MTDTESQEADFYSDFDLYIPLVADDADQAGFRIHNKPGGETHRILITGYDRHKATAVRGRLYHVVHGFSGDSNRNPATLIVFEWLLVPGKLGKRFKQVDIDVTFSAHGSRPGMLPDDDLEDYTPDVIAVAPDVPIASFFSGREITKQNSRSISLEVGYQGASFNPSLSNSSSEVIHRTDYRFIAGYPAFVNKAYGEPNSAHWTLQENSSQESGLPKLVRTAVLLERRAGDLGQFVAIVNASANIGIIANAAEGLRKIVGSIPEDDPVIFDPKSSQQVGDGASVLFGSKSVEKYQSPCDKDNLGGETLAKFLIEDDDTKWRILPENTKGSN